MSKLLTVSAALLLSVSVSQASLAQGRSDDKPGKGGGRADNGYIAVRGSSSRLHHELSQFLITLSPTEDVHQNLVGPGVSGAG